MADYFSLDFWFYQIYLFIRSTYNYVILGSESRLWHYISILSFILSFILFALLFYSAYKITGIRRREKEQFLSAFVSAADPKAEKSKEWQDILDHADGDNESQWKLALIDADKILERLLKEAGYSGEGLGEMLKTAEGGGLKSLQDAWEAHKVRNRIAHEAGFVLTKREARIAVELYKKVFEELGFV